MLEFRKPRGLVELDEGFLPSELSLKLGELEKLPKHTAYSSKRYVPTGLKPVLHFSVPYPHEHFVYGAYANNYLNKNPKMTYLKRNWRRNIIN